MEVEDAPWWEENSLGFDRMDLLEASSTDERQFTFIGGRHLLHSVIIANEVVEEAKRSQKPCLVFKVVTFRER